MCCRYARKSTMELLAEWFRLELSRVPWFLPSYNAAPQSVQPVVHLRDGGGRCISLMRWGLVPQWARDPKIGLNTINARAEEAASKPSFRESLKQRRCLVPVDAFYEWQRVSSKLRRPYAIAMQSGEPYALAGLWDEWMTPQGEPLTSFTVLTTEANELMKPIHERMPVIIAQADYTQWLDASADPRTLMRPFATETMRAWQVSERVGNVRNNEPSLLEADEPMQGHLFG